MKLRLPIVGILMVFALAWVPGLRAQDGLRGALSAAEKPGNVVLDPSARIAAADFDSDQKPDGALLLEAGLLNGERAFRIEIHATAGPNDSIIFSSNESGLSISALDVNRDGAPDIVIETAFTHERLQVFLNNGHGIFHKVRTEDYPSSDPSMPACGARLIQPPPFVCLPISGGSDSGTAQQISVLPRTRSTAIKIWCEGFLVQSAARAPSSSRAPPSLSL